MAKPPQNFSRDNVARAIRVYAGTAVKQIGRCLLSIEDNDRLSCYAEGKNVA